MCENLKFVIFETGEIIFYLKFYLFYEFSSFDIFIYFIKIAVLCC